MPRISFAGLKDPAQRPRLILWVGAVTLVLAAVMVAAMGVTSTRWFCSEGCHKVQDDTILAYQASPHSQVSCMACHMPVGSDPVTFVLHKAEALGELYLTVTGNYSLPLNATSHYALAMDSSQCTQCHNLDLRTVTPSPGIIIDHKVHEENDVHCATCHNRVAHVEDFELTLADPQTGDPNTKHADFMSMTACFRCHTLEEPAGGPEAPGECSACHPSDFDLVPASHQADDFYPKGHASLASAEYARVESAKNAENGDAEKDSGPGKGGGIGTSLPGIETVNECSTCHVQSFCSDCHGLPMPHPAEFAEDHGSLGKQDPQVCSTCHGPADRFCDDCHHGSAIEYELDARATWLSQHPAATQQLGASTCFDCHNPTYCAACHVGGSY